MTDSSSKVATEDVNDNVELVIVDETLMPKDVAEAAEVATAQDLEALISITNTNEAFKLLNLPDAYDVPTLLRAFECEIHASINNKKTRMLKPLTEAKNILLRDQIEQMIEKEGRFDLADMIPFEEACLACKGTGELYKFFRKAATVPCKFCTDGKPEDNGYVFITCRACKGTKRYKKQQKGLTINVECTRCHKDEEGKPTGLERVKCRACLGKGTFRKLVIDSKIKSTTHCRHCKGRGFVLPEPPAKKVKAASKKHHAPATPNNPVISADLGAQLKGIEVKE